MDRQTLFYRTLLANAGSPVGSNSKYYQKVLQKSGYTRYLSKTQYITTPELVILISQKQTIKEVNRYVITNITKVFLKLLMA